MHVTPLTFVENAWALNFGISSAETETLETNFIDDIVAIATNKSIDVKRLDFSKYSDAVMAFEADENISFVAAIEEPSNVIRLLLFENCDCLAPLDVNLTYRIRSMLTNRLDGSVQSIFIANKESINLLFSHSGGAFYQSNFSITGS